MIITPESTVLFDYDAKMKSDCTGLSVWRCVEVRTYAHYPHRFAMAIMAPVICRRSSLLAADGLK
jgi:hypothetical protein